MAETKVKRCDCKHEFQDKQYGPGLRLMNPMGKGEKSGDYKCTVCGKIHKGK